MAVLARETQVGLVQAMARRLALLIYYTRDEWPLRASIEAHIRAIRNWPGHMTIAVNVAFPFDLKLLASLPFDVVIYHTTAVALRWYPSGIEALNPLAEAFEHHDAYKIAMPQDDYMYTTSLCAWLNLAQVDLVLTPMQGEARALAYETLDSNVKIETILTTYLEERDVLAAKARGRSPIEEREFYVSYRAWDARPWVGEAGQQKVNVGLAAAAACERLKKPCNISLNPKDTIMGGDWFRFLLNSRAVVGVEGGSSLHDPDGKIFERVEAYLAIAPNASYREVIEAVLGGEQHHADFTALSPRHFEAILTRTAQILVEGSYSGVLKPNVHYIPVKADFSDIDAAIKRLDNTQYLEAMTERAWQDIVEAPDYHWHKFLADLAARYLKAPKAGFGVLVHFKAWWLNRRDDFNFLLLRLELAWSNAPPVIKRSLQVGFRPLRALLNRPPGWR